MEHSYYLANPDFNLSPRSLEAALISVELKGAQVGAAGRCGFAVPGEAGLRLTASLLSKISVVG